MTKNCSCSRHPERPVASDLRRLRRRLQLAWGRASGGLCSAWRPRNAPAKPRSRQAAKSIGIGCALPPCRHGFLTATRYQ